MRKFWSILVVFTCLTALWGNKVSAQSCPSVGDNIKIRFANLHINCANDSLYVDVQLSNPTAADYSVSSLSLRFTFNTAMLSNPVISSRVMTGTHTLQVQNSIWSYGLVEFSSANVVPTGGAWTTVGRLGFHVNSYNSGSVSQCINLRWQTTAPAATTAQQWISFLCQPNMVFTDYQNNFTCISDSCSSGSINPLNVSALATNVTCTGTNNGTISLSVSGGTSPYTFNWSNGATTQNVTGLSAGTYSVTVTDAAAHDTVLTNLIVGPAGLTVNAVVHDANCNASDDGTIGLTVSGGNGTYTYNWSDGSHAANRANLVPGTYSVTVVDGAGCSGTATNLVVSEPGAFVYNVVIRNVSCNGGSDGDLVFTPGGGTPPYTYLWQKLNDTTYNVEIDSLSQDKDLHNLTAGLYELQITDSHGCTGAVFYLISQPPLINITGVAGDVSNLTCYGLHNGSIDINASGGTGVISFVWSNGDSTQNLQGLSAGTYTVTATDLNGCTASHTFTVVQPDSIAITLGLNGVTNVSCNGGSNGAIDINATGGTGTLHYAWSNGATTQDLSGITAGAYSVTVTDSLGCTNAIFNLDVTEPAAIALSAITDSVSCNGTSNGAINLTATGGTAPYSYHWSNNDTTEDLSGLTAGTYAVTVTDAHGCTASLTSITVDQPNHLAIAVDSVHQVACGGANDGGINITVTGGTPAYTYAWSNGATTRNVSGLAGGTYHVTVTDAHGCLDSSTITVTEVPALTVSLNSSTDVNCNGGSDGALSINVTGGTPGYTYNWSNGQHSPLLVGLSAGAYTVTVIDSRNCSVTGTFNIGQPTALVATIGNSQNVSCNGGNNGAIDVNVTGGTAGYTYSWSNSATTQDLTNLTAGVYTLTVTDAHGCTTTVTDTITQSPVLVVSLNGSTSVSCHGGSNGALDIDVTGGNGVYTYSWSNSATTQDISGLTAGSYSVTVTDGNGCTATGTFNVTEPATLVATIGSSTNVACYGSSTGAIDVNVTGGTPAYTYAWSNGATTEDLTGLTAGVYILTVTDANGCSTTVTDTITQSPQLVVSLSGSTDVSCNGLSDGSLTINVTGGVPSYTYAWSNGASTASLTGLAAGNYDVTVTDANGCTATGTFTIGEPNALVATPINQVNIACHGGNTGSVDLNVTGGTPAYTYSWSTGATTSGISGLAAGTYDVTVIDAHNCSTTASVTITQTDSLQISLASSTDVSCNGQSNGSLVVSVTGGSGVYTYQWSTGGTTDSIGGLAAGQYTLTVIDSSSCSATASFNVNQPSPLAATDTITNVTCAGGNNGAVNLTVAGGTAPYTYYWSNGATTQNISNLIEGIYTVYVTDAHGCSTQLTASVNTLNTLVLNTASTNSSCNQTIGTASVSPTGGSAPYQYNWSNGGTTSLIDSLAAGMYTVTVTDNNGCVDSTNVRIIGGAPISVSASSTNSTCGMNNGTAHVTVGGSVPNPVIVWSNGGSGADITGLAPGAYTATVSDPNNPNGCSEQITVAVGISSPVQLSLASTDATCGNANGTATATINGGTAPYNVLWSNGANTNSASNLASGIYGLTVTDANGCSSTSTVNVANTGGPTVSVSNVTDITCAGGSNGAIDVTVAGGTAPYTYTWSNGSTAANLSGLPSGPYTVSVTDANGCSASTIATVGTSSPIVINAVKTSVTCNSSNNGTITLTVTGGIAPYTYSWSNGATTSGLSGLAAGTYTVTVADANGCFVSQPITITTPQPLVLSKQISNVTCAAGSDGAIDLTVTGGTAAYTYSWSNGAATQDLSSIAEGIYTVTVTDANGCSAEATAGVNTENTLILNTAATNATCGNADGIATVAPSGGVAPYTFAWSNGATSDTASGLAVGVYTVTVTDGHGCSKTANVVVSTPGLSITANITDETCGSTASGAIAATVTGGTAPYTYLWSNGNTTANPTGLVAGTYNVTVTDAAGCSGAQSFNVGTNSGLTLAASPVDASSCGANDGSATANVSGGSGSYTYHWSNGQTTATATGLHAGVYFVTATDVNGCSSTASVTVGNVGGPTAAIGNITDITCAGGANGAIAVTATGGTAPYSYSWSNGGSTDALTGLFAGPYTVTITDANGCSAAASGRIGTTTPIVAIADKFNPSCSSAAGGSINTTVTGGVGPYTYAWSNGLTTSSLSGLVSGSYILTVTDANGCSVSTPVDIIAPQPLAIVTAVTDVTCANGTDGAIDLTVTGGITPYTYHWSNGATTEDVAGIPAGIYTVLVTDAHGCSATATIGVYTKNTLVLNTGATNASCGTSDGVATVSVSGGGAPYSYSWNTGGTNDTIFNQPAGVYTVSVTDGHGCTQAATVTISNINNININASTTNATCGGGANGSVTLTVSGGTAPYVYVWNDNDSSANRSGLAAGTYSVTVYDETGCAAVRSVTIGTDASFSLSIAANDAGCSTADGSATVSVTGGSGNFTYNWSNGQTTATDSNLLHGYYAVTVTDANGCSATASTLISDVDGPEISVNSVTNISCASGSTGAIDIDVTGAGGIITYNWSNGDTTQDISGLLPGVYVVTVTTQSGCDAVASVTVGTSTPINIIANKTNISCNGSGNGAIDLSVDGGLAPYTYAWSNGATSQSLSGLAAGDYTVTVTDANGCSATTPVHIGTPQPMVLTSSITNVLCAGGSNGAIDLTVTGGTAPYSYTWSNGATTEDINSLTAGLYSVIVTDANGCSVQSTISVLTINNLVLNTGATNASCGDSTGTATVSVSGGNAPYSYNWSNGGLTSSISNIASGNYSVVVTDSNGCSTSSTVSVGNTSSLVISGTTGDARCGNASGSVTLTVSGGSVPYSYTWSNGGSGSSLSNLTAGTYDVTVTDSTGCSKVAQFVVNEVPSITIVPQVSLPNCGANDGAIGLTVTGGDGNYTYHWSNGATSSSLSNIAVGVYRLTVTDGSGCSATSLISVRNSAGPIVTVDTVINLSCSNGHNGAINISVAGGAGSNYTYSWSNSATTEDLSNLLAGTYAVTVTDTNGCIATASATVIAPTAIVIVADAHNATCNGSSNGSIDLTATGGVAPYTYAWSNGATTANITGLAAGTYNVTVTDANGCSVTTPVTIGQPLPIVVTLDSSSNVTCNGSANGSIYVTVTGGSAPYGYTWSNGSHAEDQTGLAAGVYTLTVTDANGCSNTSFVDTITEPQPYSLSISQVDSIACHGGTGAVTVAPNGGTAPYTFDWSDGQHGATASGLTAGTYYVIGHDAGGCASDTAYVTLSQPDTIEIMLGGMTGRCAGYTDGDLVAKVMGGTAPYTYAWSGSASTSDSVGGLSAGTYAVTVTDAHGCSQIATRVLQPVAPINLTDSSRVTNANCDTLTGTISIVALDGHGPYTYAWNGGNTSSTRNDLAVGSYTVTVTDANGCSVAGTFNVGDDCDKGPVANPDTAQTTTNHEVKIPVMHNDYDSSGHNIYVTGITLEPNHGTVTINSDGTITYTPSTGFVGVDTFIYNLCNDATPPKCDTAMVIVLVLPDRPNVQIPNGFSPNGDGFNDFFVVPDIDKYPGSQFIVFNRWGNKVWESDKSGYVNNWNGTNQSNEPLPDGTYYYILTIKDGHDTKYEGFVTIHR